MKQLTETVRQHLRNDLSITNNEIETRLKKKSNEADIKASINLGCAILQLMADHTPIMDKPWVDPKDKTTKWMESRVGF